MTKWKAVFPRFSTVKMSSESVYGLLFVKEQVPDLAEIHREICWAVHVTVSTPENQYRQSTYLFTTLKRKVPPFDTALWVVRLQGVFASLVLLRSYVDT